MNTEFFQIKSFLNILRKRVKYQGEKNKKNSSKLQYRDWSDRNDFQKVIKINFKLLNYFKFI